MLIPNEKEENKTENCTKNRLVSFSLWILFELIISKVMLICYFANAYEKKFCEKIF